MNFDSIITRRGSGSIKWDRRPELDPFWVADMDFVSPQPVLDAIQQRLSHGVLGYAQPHEGIAEALDSYLGSRHEVKVDEEQIVHLGGLVPALSLAARAFVKPGEEVMICTPVYYPFLHVAGDAKAETLAIPHVFSDGRWTFDWEQMEAQVSSKTKIFILCNPQNPLGRNFTPDEIIKVAEFCQRHDLVLVSDEIHCDLVLNEDEQAFYSALKLPENLREKLIVLQAPSKTYNIAGMGYAFAIIENPTIRRKFCAARGHTLAEINCLAFYAAEAAYKHGEPWRQELLAYLRKNRDTVTDFVRSELPACSIPFNEATYLALIDTRAAGIKNPAKVIEENAQVWVNDGAAFGAPDHFRFNYGCPHARVLEGLEKIKPALGF
ncbi:MalY/PatB family protein [Rubritalea marina]|uniref:MalY/PatB family protein n=1 Tax=Rubritalea marina TaxID=361055 RepID=UPI0003684336|nr:PatB family C-S lyase [Rubritalea marina]